MHREPRIEIRDLTVTIGSRGILEDVTLYVKGPGLVQVLGPNGAGKTTLLKTMIGLLKPAKGSVKLCGVDVTSNPRRAMRYAAYVPQLPPTPHGYPLTPRELLAYTGIDEEAMEEAFNRLGIPREYWDRPIDELSAGLRQRVFIAHALARKTPIILLDEPLSSIDPAARAELAEALHNLSRHRLLVVTSHDPAILLPCTTYMILLKRRIYAAGPPDKVLTLENAKRVYGRAALKLAVHLHIADSH